MANPRTYTNFINASTTESPADMAATARHFGMDMEISTVSDSNGEVTKIDSKTGQPIAEPTEPAAADSTDPASQVPSKPAKAAPQATPAPDAASTGTTGADLDPADDDPDAAADPDSTAADPDPADADPPVSPPPADADKAKHKKLLKQVDKLTGRLRTEEDKSGRMAAELAELRAQVAGITSPVTVVDDSAPAQPTVPDRPKRPKLADFALDQDKYESAMDKYESDLTTYEAARDAFTREQAIRQVREDQARQAAEAVAAQRAQKWDAAKSAYPDIDDKLADTTGSVSNAMTAVLREVYDPKEAWALLNYLADNPDESTRIAQMTLASTGKPGAAEFALLAAVATRELAKLESKIEAAKSPEAAKPVAAAATKPAQSASAPPASSAPASTPPASSSQPSATKRPPVSAAKPPITPVTAHADTTAPVDLTSDKTSTAVYMAERQKQRLAKLGRQMGRA